MIDAFIFWLMKPLAEIAFFVIVVLILAFMLRGKL
jgi:hypothetical protein